MDFIPALLIRLESLIIMRSRRILLYMAIHDPYSNISQKAGESMQFNIFTDVRKFADKTLYVLLQREIENNLLITNINRGLEREDTSDMYMATVEAGDEVLLAAVRTEPHALVIYEACGSENSEALEIFAKGLLESAGKTPEILCEAGLAKRFCVKYHSLSGKGYEKIENLVLYKLEKLAEPYYTQGLLRKAEERDMHFLPYWLADFHPACNIGEYDIKLGIKSAINDIGKSTTYLWEDDGFARVTRDGLETYTSMRAHRKGVYPASIPR